MKAQFITPTSRAVLNDVPLTRTKRGLRWYGARSDFSQTVVNGLINRGLLTIDIDKDPFGRTATITEEGMAALLAQ